MDRGSSTGWVRLIVACSCVIGSAEADAELVYFAQGGSAQVPATIEGEDVRIETPGRIYRFQRDDFRKIVPGYWPATEWAARRDQAMTGGAPDRFAAAWWALGHGLTPEAEEMIRAANAVDPAHQPAERLVTLLDLLASPLPDPDPVLLNSLKRRGQSIAVGPHVVLIHEQTEAEARDRLEMLERVFRSFYLYFSAQGFTLHLPERRLIAISFAHRVDYLARLHEEDAGDFLTTRGYYHPTKRYVMAYEARDDPATRREWMEIESRDRELAHRPEPQRSRLRRDLDRRSLLLDLRCRTLDVATAAHEMTHQLVAESGLAPRYDDFPIWLHEGLAMQFEVVRGGRWAGIGGANELRLSELRKIPPAPKLELLLRDQGFGHGYRPDRYAEAWALVYYLRKEHPQAFVSLLDHLRVPRTEGETRADRTVQAFRAVVGESLEEWEADWRVYMARIETPRESEQPDR